VTFTSTSIGIRALLPRLEHLTVKEKKIQEEEKVKISKVCTWKRILK